MLCTRQLLPDATVTIVRSVLECIQAQICRFLILRLQYKAQVAFCIIYKVGVELLSTIAERICVTIESNSLPFFAKELLL